MFVWTGYFLNTQGIDPAKAVTFYGQEKAETNTRLSRMNLAVHGLEGQIAEGNTFYDRRAELVGQCDYVMANPPFNVDGVDPARLKNDPRLPFGLPGLAQKTNAISNANYLWIQYFYSYLNERGRAGFVMASSATDAGHSEKALRQKLLQTGHVDVIVAIGTNFFYTLTLPCTLWFFDKRQPAERRDKVLMLDARSIYRVVTRKIRDFSDEQLANLTAIAWLYRGETGRYLNLVQSYLGKVISQANSLRTLQALSKPVCRSLTALSEFSRVLQANHEANGSDPQVFEDMYHQVETAHQDWETACETLQPELDACLDWLKAHELESNAAQQEARQRLAALEPGLKEAQHRMDETLKLALRTLELAEKTAGARRSEAGRGLRSEIEKWQGQVQQRNERFHSLFYFLHQAAWLQSRFPEAVYADVAGLCKAVTLEEIEGKDWSLTPGRYVGVGVQQLDEGDDFQQRVFEIHIELQALNDEAVELAKKIFVNFGELTL